VHELGALPARDQVEGVEPGLYHYDGVTHALEPVAPAGPATDLLVQQGRSAGLMTSDPQVLLTVTARFGRVMWKYDTIAYSLILNTSVLFQTIYLVATAMGLAVCGLGGGDAQAFATRPGSTASRKAASANSYWAAGLRFCPSRGAAEFSRVSAFRGPTRQQPADGERDGDEQRASRAGCPARQRDAVPLSGPRPGTVLDLDLVEEERGQHRDAERGAELLQRLEQPRTPSRPRDRRSRRR